MNINKIIEVQKILEFLMSFNLGNTDEVILAEVNFLVDHLIINMSENLLIELNNKDVVCINIKCHIFNVTECGDDPKLDILFNLMDSIQY